MGKEQHRALALHLSMTPAGYCVSADDMAGESRKEVRLIGHYLSREFDKATFDDLAFDEKVLADFGYEILARLYAYAEVGQVKGD
jgi:hypothetical protein